MDDLGVLGQVLAEFPHLSGWFHAVDLAAVPEHLCEGHCARAQTRPEVQEGGGLVAVEHFLDLVEYSVRDRICPRAPVEQVGDGDVLGVLDFLFKGVPVDLWLLLALLEDLLLAGEVDLLHPAVEGQLLLQFLEVGLGEEVVVDLLLVVPELHEVGEVEGDVPELPLVVLVEYLLHVLHVLVRQKLLGESYP